jgi:hypothetical protein
MTTPRLAGLVARYLARTADRLRWPAGSGTRTRGVALVEEALRQRARRRLLVQTVFGIAAAAAAAGVVLAATHHRVGASSVAASPRPNRSDEARVDIVTEGRPLGAGERVSTQAGGSADLSLSTGTRILLEERTDVVVESAGLLEAFGIERGAIDAQVAKLEPGQRFVVHTPDAEIEVRGTQFRVRVVAADPSCSSGTVTRVEVSEGVVAVRHAGIETLAGPGSSWPPGCAPVPARAAPVQLPPPASTIAQKSSSPSASSTLGDQNALFARAIAAKQRGDTSGAIADFEKLLATYPGSPLAESAAAERMRLLSSIDPRRGAEAAREYLRRWPDGLVRAEAQGIAEQSP